jgi:hypothetical protein
MPSRPGQWFKLSSSSPALPPNFHHFVTLSSQLSKTAPSPAHTKVTLPLQQRTHICTTNPSVPTVTRTDNAKFTSEHVKEPAGGDQTWSRTDDGEGAAQGEASHEARAGGHRRAIEALGSSVELSHSDTLKWTSFACTLELLFTQPCHCQRLQWSPYHLLAGYAVAQVRFGLVSQVPRVDFGRSKTTLGDARGRPRGAVICWLILTCRSAREQMTLLVAQR